MSPIRKAALKSWMPRPEILATMVLLGLGLGFGHRGVLPAVAFLVGLFAGCGYVVLLMTCLPAPETGHADRSDAESGQTDDGTEG